MPDTQGNEEKAATQTVIVKYESFNGLAIAGFALALVALFVGWIPVFGWMVWFLGLVFSIVGLFRRPRGLAVAGLAISIIGPLFFVLMFFAFLSGV